MNEEETNKLKAALVNANATIKSNQCIINTHIEVMRKQMAALKELKLAYEEKGSLCEEYRTAYFYCLDMIEAQRKHISEYGSAIDKYKALTTNVSALAIYYRDKCVQYNIV